ncbi:MAG: nicotinate-nucleotide pyrophosphorylase (carboxylating), partial [Myxococcota bacterium]
MSHIQPQVDQLITLALAEDIGTGDQTSLATIAASTLGTARILAKEPLVLAGLPYFTRVFELLDPSVVVEASVPEGTAVPAMTVVGRLSGPARSLLMGE